MSIFEIILCPSLAFDEINTDVSFAHWTIISSGPFSAALPLTSTLCIYVPWQRETNCLNHLFVRLNKNFTVDFTPHVHS